MPVPNLGEISGLTWAVYKGFNCVRVLQVSPTGAIGLCVCVYSRGHALASGSGLWLGSGRVREMLRLAVLRHSHTSAAAGTMAGGT